MLCAYIFFLLHGHEMGKGAKFESLHKKRKGLWFTSWAPSSGLEHGEVRDYSNVIVVWQPRRSYS